MKYASSNKFILIFLLLFFACSKSEDTPTDPNAKPIGNPGDGKLGNGQAGLVAAPGIEAWDKLATTEKARVKAWNVLFIHQSVGSDLEDGAESNGFKFEYYGPDQKLNDGLNGAIFTDAGNIPNGQPFDKLNFFKNTCLKHKGKLQIAIFKFGYADVRDEDLVKVQTAYLQMCNDLKQAGIRVMHITPPIVYNVDENPPKMKMRTWMISTFKDDVVFDLQDIESSLSGSRCEVGGIWRICQDVRSTASCPSKGQGIDGNGAGHLCEKVAVRISKAFLFSIYQVGK